MPKVLETLPNAASRGELEESQVLARVSGRMRKRFIRIPLRVGGVVAYDLNRGRITYRYK